MIEILDKNTIDQIAAGEVIERPASIVKELLENALDSGAEAISIEIRDGGISLIRVPDNGSGIEKEEVKKAFLRHATSKIKSAKDLESVLTLGFRGEALSSIAAISKIEMLSKRHGELTGVRYCVEGGADRSFEEVGTPEGTTVIVREVFFNTPARRKFLKSYQTEGAYVSDFVQKLAFSNRYISFKYVNNNKTLLHTSGNGRLKDIIYQIYGKNTAASVLELDYRDNDFKISGVIGRPEICSASRNMEIIFVNGRCIKDRYISKGLEDGFGDRLMHHRYPFAVLYLEANPQMVDINVHPGKLEVRFEAPEAVYKAVALAVSEALENESLIRQVSIKTQKSLPMAANTAYKLPEPFELQRAGQIREAAREVLPKGNETNHGFSYKADASADNAAQNIAKKNTILKSSSEDCLNNIQAAPVQLDFLSEQARPYHRIVGQLFGTYWIIEFKDKMYFIDQHAAHEKVMYEKFLTQRKEASLTSQLLSPPLIITLSDIEAEAAARYSEYLLRLGFEIENFGGRDYSISAVPSFLPSVSKEAVLREILTGLVQLNTVRESVSILEKIASMSCKAAVKGNQSLSYNEVNKLIDDLLALDNPYNCPHGRPTIIEMTKYELEKKFKRIL